MTSALYFLFLTLVTTSASGAKNNVGSTLITSISRINDSVGFIPEIPKECAGKPFCTKILNLPAKFKDFLATHQKFVTDFYADPSAYEYLRDNDVKEEGESLCEQEEKDLPPISALRDYLGKLRLVVAADYVFEKVKTCGPGSEEGSQCSAVDAARVEVEQGYTKKCEQGYRYINLLTYSDINKTPKPKLMQVPTCCKCTIITENN